MVTIDDRASASQATGRSTTRRADAVPALEQAHARREHPMTDEKVREALAELAWCD